MMKKGKSNTENLWNAKDPLMYAEFKLGIELDEWQRKYIKTEGNTAVRAGRQSGKSFAESLRVALFALLNDKTQTLVIGSVERQSFELFEKIQSHIHALAPTQIKGRPTMHKLELRNGSSIRAEPCGRTGAGLRGFTIHKLVVDEAHYVPEEVFTAIRPMLATTGGTIDVLSTPRGNEGFFYDCFSDDNFTCFHTKSEDCPRITKEFLDKERKRMTKLQFCQEYEAEFLDSLQQFFPRELIDACTENFSLSFNSRQYMGVDVARYGGDENAFVVVGLTHRNKLEVMRIETSQRVSTVATMNRIIDMNKAHNFKKIYIDDGGIGGAVLDVLLEDNKLKRKVVGINNASRSINADKTRGKKLLKEDLYGNLKRLMEQGLIKMPDDDRLRQSLLSIQYEYTDNNNFRIFGKYSHITEGLIRAAWCIKSKGLNILAFC